MKVEFCYWNHEKQQLITVDGVILHWGIDCDQSDNGDLFQFTVVFIADSEGIVRKVFPTDMQIINENNQSEKKI